MKKVIICTLLFVSVLSGCSVENKELDYPEETIISHISQNPYAVEQGVIRVKLEPDIGDYFSAKSTADGKVRSSDNSIDDYLTDIGATRMTRVFPYAGKYEERTRREGLHLWYDIVFEKTYPVTRATSIAQTIKGVEIVEEIHKISLSSHYFTFSENLTPKKSSNSPFNDPHIEDQWHYNNDGRRITGAVAGADVNLFNAWNKETGKANVIISVVDGGIDFMHEDLKDNMWINEAELNGLPGVDDDGNGFVDDVHGFNFITNTGNVTPERHGTHVAGTVAARNNNGVGVAGIAGGNGMIESGVKLMSCQMFMGSSSSGGAAPIKYGADNGAVISQNSWTYVFPGPNTLPTSMKEAIDYFIKYAGCDNDGNQLPESPMKGGVVIFAAGNDNEDYLVYPSAYAPVVSVAAMGPNFKKAYYSNQGSWISIMAPGGDDSYNKGMVLSTLPNNKYGYSQGTSMACPHVTGIAALVVSKFGGQGFTNEELKERITTAFRPVDIDAMNPNYIGRLGKGYIDADKALSINESKIPEKINSVSVEEGFTWLELSWNAVNDEDDGSAILYKLYYSNEQLNSNNYKKGSLIDINGVAFSAGDKVIYRLHNLLLNTEFHFALIAEDRWGLQSPPIFFSAKTKENLPPNLIISSSEDIRITGTETIELKIIVEEPEGQQWESTITGQTQGVSHIEEKDGILLKIEAKAPIGTHKVIIKVTDIFNASSTIEVPFEIYKNSPPRRLKNFGKIYIPNNQVDYVINLSDYFIDEDGHDITYEARSTDSYKVDVSLLTSKLILNPKNIGTVSVVVTATDAQNSSTQTTIQIQVVKDELVYIMYPVPVKDILNIRLSDEVQNATMYIYTTTGTQVLKQSVNAATEEQRMVQLNVSLLSGGTYVLQVVANGKTYKQVFVKI